MDRENYGTLYRPEVLLVAEQELDKIVSRLPGMSAGSDHIADDKYLIPDL